MAEVKFEGTSVSPVAMPNASNHIKRYGGIVDHGNLSKWRQQRHVVVEVSLGAIQTGYVGYLVNFQSLNGPT